MWISAASLNICTHPDSRDTFIFSGTFRALPVFVYHSETVAGGLSWIDSFSRRGNCWDCNDYARCDQIREVGRVQIIAAQSVGKHRCAINGSGRSLDQNCDVTLYMDVQIRERGGAWISVLWSNTGARLSIQAL